MRITKLIAKNIASIYTAMGKKTIELDLFNQKNRSIILAGPSGSGKTSIMELLQPFPYPGAFDVRSGKGYIRKDEDGYKEIHYDHDGSYYIIKHFYMFKTGTSIKSFFMKDGVELNTNGNSRSFYELVELEFEVRPELFRLLRLGSNMSGLIDMKKTERKGFIADLLKDVNVYLQLHKTVNEKSRSTRALIKSITDKILKLKVFNENDEKARIDSLSVELDAIKSERDSISRDNGRIEAQLESIMPGGSEAFDAAYRAAKNAYGTTMDEMKKITHKLSKSQAVIMGSVDDSISTTTKLIDRTHSEYMLNVSKLEFYNTQLDSLHIQKSEKEGNLKYVSSESEYDKLKSYLDDMKRKQSIADIKFKSFVPACTSADIIRALVVLQEISTIAYDIYAGSKSTVKTVVDMILDRYSVDAYVKDEVSKIDSKIAKLYSDSNSMASHVMNKDKFYMLYVPPENNCSCPYKDFYEDNKDSGKREENKVSISKEIAALEAKRDTILSYQDVSRAIAHIMILLKSNKDLSDKMPEKFLTADVILNKMKGNGPIYDEPHITSYIALLEEYEEYKSMISHIQEIEKELKFVEINSGSLISLRNELDSLTDTIAKLESDMGDIHRQNLEIDKKLVSYRTALELLIEHKTLSDRFEAVSIELTESSNVVESMSVNFMTMRTHTNSIMDNNVRMARLNTAMKGIEDEINNIKYRLLEFASLEIEKVQLEERFEELELTKDALSSNKGIPLLYTELYMNGARGAINELLYSAYKGSLEIEEFIVNESEFSVPYTKNGITVEDARHCSQGERSMISLALSFGIIQQSLKVYNVIELDEIDGSLDPDLRAAFMSILESQLDAIGCEQCFIITHNSLFDNYNVDLIVTGPVSIDNFKNKNVLYAA